MGSLISLDKLTIHGDNPFLIRSLASCEQFKSLTLNVNWIYPNDTVILHDRTNIHGPFNSSLRSPGGVEHPSNLRCPTPSISHSPIIPTPVSPVFPKFTYIKPPIFLETEREACQQVLYLCAESL